MQPSAFEEMSKTNKLAQPQTNKLAQPQTCRAGIILSELELQQKILKQSNLHERKILVSHNTSTYTKAQVNTKTWADSVTWVFHKNVFFCTTHHASAWG